MRGYDGVRGARADKVAARIASRVRPGAIIAMHDSAESGDREPASVQALPRVLDAISERKLEMVTVSELFEGEQD